jgi:outer membrane protein assembly factor BamB
MLNAQRIGSVSDRFRPPLRLVWKYEIGEYMSGSLVIANGMVYVTGGKLRALDSATGECRWQARIKAFAAAAAWHDRIVVLDIERGIYLVEATSGRITMHIPSPGVMASLCVAHDRLYWLASDRTMRAADAHTGEILWTHRYRYQSLITPTAHHNLIYCADWHLVYALDADTGTVRWQWEFSGETANVKDTLAVYDDMLLVPIVGVGIVAFDAHTGQVRWRSRHTGVRSAVAVTADCVYAILPHLTALDRHTGDVIWVHNPNDPRPQFNISAPIVVGDHLYIGGGNERRYYGFDRHTGEQVWDYPTGDLVFSTPAYANGRLVIGCHDGFVYCFEQA